MLRPTNPQSILSYLCVSYILQPHLLVNPVVTNLILLRIQPLSHHLQSYLLVQVTIIYKTNFIYSSSLSFPHCTILSQHVSQSSSCHCWKLPFTSHLRVKSPVLRATSRAVHVLAPLVTSLTSSPTFLLLSHSAAARLVLLFLRHTKPVPLCSCFSLCLEHFPSDFLMLSWNERNIWISVTFHLFIEISQLPCGG